MCPWLSPMAAKRMRPPSARVRPDSKELAVIPAAEATVVLRKSRRSFFACDIVLTPLAKRSNCLCRDEMETLPRLRRLNLAVSLWSLRNKSKHTARDATVLPVEFHARRYDRAARISLSLFVSTCFDFHLLGVVSPARPPTALAVQPSSSGAIVCWS